MSGAVTVYEQEKATYSVLDKPVASAIQNNETVVEFFSFYNPPCYAFSQGYGIDKCYPRKLTYRKKLVKYHTRFSGGLLSCQACL